MTESLLKNTIVSCKKRHEKRIYPVCPFLQDSEGLADLVADRVHRDAQFRGDLLIFQSVPLAQQEHLTAFLRQGIYRRPQSGLYLRSLLSIIVINDPVCILRLEFLRLESLLTEPVKAPVPDSPVEIRPPVRHLRSGAYLLPKRGKTLLHHILDRIRIIQIVQGIKAQRPVIISERTLHPFKGTKRIVFLHSTFSRELRLIGGNTTKVGEKNCDMKTLLRTVLTLALLIPLQAASYARNDQDPTVKEQMMVIHEHFGVNFIYDSSLGLDIQAPQRINPSRQTLEECLTAVFEGTGIEWEIMKKYVVLTHKDKKRKPRDYTIFVEEQHDTLNESIITAHTTKELNTTQTGFQKIDRIAFERGFATFSSPDVIKTLQQMPGVATGTELLSGMYVRGGDGSDNLYLLDGVPMYQVSHLAGLFSSFNTDVVESVDFYKSGFPARYGGRLSSVVDVRTREGDFKDYHGLFSIGLLDGRLQFEGPIWKDRTSFNIGLRRSWIDVLSEPVCLLIGAGENLDFRVKYAFWDLNANITHKFSTNNKLSLNIYGGRDAAKYSQSNYWDYPDYYSSYEMDYGLEWGNFVTSLDWDYRFADNHETAVKAYFSRYGSLFGSSDKGQDRNDCRNEDYTRFSANRSRTSDVGLLADFSFRPHEKHHLRYGAHLQYHFYNPECISENHETVNGETINDKNSVQRAPRHSFEPAVYIEDEMSLTDWFTANIGLRYSAVLTDGKAYHSVQPRAALRFDCGDYTALKVSYSEMMQNNHLISSNYLQLPTSFWMPSTGKIAPSHSRQVSGGVYVNFPHNIKFNAEGWFKTMDNLLEFRGKWGLYPPIHLWEKSMVVGKGRSWGLESELSWSDANTSVTACYTLSWSQRLFEDFYPFWYRDRNDNRHKVTLTATRRFGKKFEMYASWNWHSGCRMTGESQAIWDGTIGEGWPDTFYGEPNNLKLPDYHRLDVGFNFRKTTKRGNESIWNLSIYNAYCRINPIVAYLGEDYNFTEENITGFNFIGEAFGIIPIIPSFSYTLKF